MGERAQAPPQCPEALAPVPQRTLPMRPLSNTKERTLGVARAQGRYHLHSKGLKLKNRAVSDFPDATAVLTKGGACGKRVKNTAVLKVARNFQELEVKYIKKKKTNNPSCFSSEDITQGLLGPPRVGWKLLEHLSWCDTGEVSGEERKESIVPEWGGHRWGQGTSTTWIQGLRGRGGLFMCPQRSAAQDKTSHPPQLAGV